MQAQPWRILMSSDVFGTETFEYDTTREMIAGMRRLQKSCRKQKQDDGIERSLVAQKVVTQERRIAQ